VGGDCGQESYHINWVDGCSGGRIDRLRFENGDRGDGAATPAASAGLMPPPPETYVAPPAPTRTYISKRRQARKERRHARRHARRTARTTSTITAPAPGGPTGAYGQPTQTYGSPTNVYGQPNQTYGIPGAGQPSPSPTAPTR
jgi:hypothetical protein